MTLAFLGLLAAGDRALIGQEEPPPATVGMVKGLAVTEDLEGTYSEGSLFPVRVTVTGPDPKEPDRLWESSCPLDKWAVQMIADAFAYLAGEAKAGGLKLPADFPGKHHYRIEFVDAGGLVAGDSAGVATAIALYSALTETPVLNDVAVTGAITPRGEVKSVGDIARKIDGVIRSHTGTMIVPGDNANTTANEMRELLRKAFPATRIVFAWNMKQVFFHAFGPYGPQGEQYRAFARETTEARRLLTQRRFPEAVAAFTALWKEHPEDNTPLVWIENIKRAHFEDLIQKARKELSYGDKPRANDFVKKAQEIDPDAPEITTLLREIAGLPPDPRSAPSSPVSSAAGSYVPKRKMNLPKALPPDGPVVAQWSEKAARSPTDPLWSAVTPRAFALHPVGDGPPTGWPPKAEPGGLVSAVYTPAGLCLLVCFRDEDGRADRTPEQWEITSTGFRILGGDDGLLVLWDRDLRTGAVLVNNSGFLTKDGVTPVQGGGVDAWLWRAGTTDKVEAADNLHVGAKGLVGDPGRAPYLRNANAQRTGPRYAFNGSPGAYGPGTLDLEALAELHGDPIAGRSDFERGCARCHTKGGVAGQGSPLSDLALRTAGTEARLKQLLSTPPHAQYADGLSADNLVALVQVSPRVPTIICAPPSGSRGNVSATSLFEDGWWYVCLYRRLVTGAPDDMPVVPDQEYGFFLVTEDGGADGRFVSDRIRLAFAPSGKR